MLVAPNHTHTSQQWGSLGIGTAETIVLAAVLISGSTYLSRARS